MNDGLSRGTPDDGSREKWKRFVRDELRETTEDEGMDSDTFLRLRLDGKVGRPHRWALTEAQEMASETRGLTYTRYVWKGVKLSTLVGDGRYDRVTKAVRRGWSLKEALEYDVQRHGGTMP